MLRRDHVEVRLISDLAQKDDRLRLGVHFKIDPEWHIYWKNPGDSGAAPKFDLSGGKILEILWPYPTRLPVGDLTNFGYSREVVFILETRPELEQIKLSLEWLVCKVECIPGFGTFTFTRSSLTKDAKLMAEYSSRVPGVAANWEVSVLEKTQDLHLQLITSTMKVTDIKSLFIFPGNGEVFQASLPTIEPRRDSLKIAMPLLANAPPEVDSDELTFVVEKANGEILSFTKSISLAKLPTSWLMGLLLAFLGGMTLNLMPCVFPVLFLKAFAILKESDTKVIRSSGWKYFWGVVLSFLAIGGLLTLLRFSGESVGWGYQLQNPISIYLLAILFFMMALNFFGFFEWGDALASSAGRLSNHRLFTGSFGTGVLAVVVASPCTAPFMGTALGLTLLLPVHQSLLIFVALGVGMAFPFLVLSYVPNLGRHLPRSGPWMVVVKQLLSFPLFITCLWLLWVLAQQKGVEATFVALTSFLFLALGIWLMSLGKKALLKGVAWVICVGTVFAGGYFIRQIQPSPAGVAVASAWSSFNEAEITERRKAQAVFIDFTASWCITCQVNKRTVLDTAEIQNLFKSHNVFLVRADWTNHDPKVTQALARFNRNSVPFYVFYNKMGDVKILSEILTKDMIRNLLEGESK